MTGGFFRVEADDMHQLIMGMGRCEDDLGEVTSGMRDAAGDGCGSAGLDSAVRDLAGRMGDKGDELVEHIAAVLDRLRACLELYEGVDRAWAENFGLGDSPGAATDPNSSISAALDGDSR